MIAPLKIGQLKFEHNLIQGPLAGYSCAAFRRLFYLYTPPAYCVTEMLSAHDIVNSHKNQDRYLSRALIETYLCYQIAGSDPTLMAKAAHKLEALGADLIDINCGCPKTKIRKKGAGSALLENQDRLLFIVDAVRASINCPLTLKLRLTYQEADLALCKRLESAGVDALIIHGRRWNEDYDIPNNLEEISNIKHSVKLPVIANGDVQDVASLAKTFTQTSCDAVMIGREGTGKPWLYEMLLTQESMQITDTELKDLFLQHLDYLVELDREYSAVLQSRSLIRYYFRHKLSQSELNHYYQLTLIKDIKNWFASRFS